MSLESLVIWLVVGAVAGWLAGVIVKGAGFGLIGNIILGIIGAYVGSWAFGALGISLGTGMLNTILGATAGAVIVLIVVSLVRRAT